MKKFLDNKTAIISAMLLIVGILFTVGCVSNQTRTKTEEDKLAQIAVTERIKQLSGKEKNKELISGYKDILSKLKNADSDNWKKRLAGYEELMVLNAIAENSLSKEKQKENPNPERIRNLEVKKETTLHLLKIKETRINLANLGITFETEGYGDLLKKARSKRQKLLKQLMEVYPDPKLFNIVYSKVLKEPVSGGFGSEGVGLESTYQSIAEEKGISEDKVQKNASKALEIMTSNGVKQLTNTEQSLMAWVLGGGGEDALALIKVAEDQDIIPKYVNQKIDEEALVKTSKKLTHVQTIIKEVKAVAELQGKQVP